MSTIFFNVDNSVTERVQRYELNRVSDVELLSLFLSRRQDQSTEAWARALLAEYGSLSALIGRLLGDG